MAYIGKQPLVGNFTLLDSITATTTDTYALTKDSVAVFPQTPANCIVSLNGVIQAPTDSYTISGSDIVFASALTGSDSIDFITVLGDVLNVGTVSDGTIGLAKLSATGTKDATTFLRGDNTFASAGATAGQVIQVLSSNIDGTVSTSSGTYATTSQSLSITPASASNKVLVLFDCGVSTTTANTSIDIDIRRAGTSIAICGMYTATVSGNLSTMGGTSVLDSPNTTSATKHGRLFHFDCLDCHAMSYFNVCDYSTIDSHDQTKNARPTS